MSLERRTYAEDSKKRTGLHARRADGRSCHHRHLGGRSHPQYQKYQARSRQTEAKIELGSVYTAEQSFSVENSTFTLCLLEIGATSTGAANYYSYGFVTADTGKCGNTGALSCLIYSPSTATACVGGAGDAYFAATATASKAQGAIATTPQAASTVTNQTTFLAGAQGQVSTTQAKYDQWTIDQNKALGNTVNAL